MDIAPIVYAIGDVHGHLDALRHIIDRVLADAAEHGIARPPVVLLGDYVDRGPDSNGVLELLTSGDLHSVLDPVCLLGNHEAALLQVLRGGNPEAWFDEGGFSTMQSYMRWHGHLLDPSWYRAFVDTFPRRHLDFLSDLTASHQVGHWLFSHAGINPHKPMSAQSKADYVYGHRPFREWPEPLEGGIRVVHGHWREPGDRVAILPHRVGVDTGCGSSGGHLSAVAVGDGGVRVLDP